MAILLSIDETFGTQTTSGGGVTSTDTTATLPSRYDAVLATETAGSGTSIGTAVSGASAGNPTGVNVITFSSPVTDASIVNAAGAEFNGELSGLKTTDGHAIQLFTSLLDNNVLLGKDAVTGNVVFAIILDTGVATLGTDTDVGATGAKLWLVQYDSIYQPIATDPNDVVSLQNTLYIGADTLTNFMLTNAPAGQNLFMMFGDGTPSPSEAALVVTALNPASGGTVNTGLGGGGTTLGTDNQMIVPGKGLIFSFVTGANTNFTVPNLDQNEADIAANIQFTSFFGTSQASFSVVQLQPPKDATMTLTALNETDNTESGAAYITGLTDNDSPQVNIESVSILRAGQTVTLTAATGQVSTGTGAAQIWADFTGSAVVLKGIEAGDRITYVTSGNHTRLMLQNTGDPKDNTFGASFDVGGFTIQGGSISTVGIQAIAFVDDAPTVSGNSTVHLDDDALPGGIPNGPADRAPDTENLTGTLGLSFGTDGPAVDPLLPPAVAWSTTDAPTGFTYEKAPNGNLWIKQGTTTVMTLTVDASGHYTVTQNNPVMHAAGGNDETGMDFTVHYVVTDGDGDQATGDLVINVNDDTPTASIVRTTANAILDESATSHDGDTNATADNASAANDPFTGAYGTPFGAVAGVGLVTPAGSAGADGGGSFSVTLGIEGGSGASSGLSTAAGAIDLWLEANGTVTGRVGGSGGQVAFAIRINSAGQVDVTQYVALTHGNTTSYDESLDLSGKLNAVVTQTDADGDSVTQSVGIGNAVQFQDDGPQVSTNALVQLDDDALTGGNPGGSGDVTPDTAHTTGTLGHDFGRDGAGSVAWLDTGAPAGFNYVLESGNLLIKQGLTTVMTLTVATDGSYTVMQSAPVMHAPGSDENGADFTVSYRVTDGDGDTATGQLAINVNDDTPTATIVRTTANAVLDESLVLHDGDTNATADNAPPATDPFGTTYGAAFGVVSGAGLVTPAASAGADGGGTFSVTLGIVGGSGASSGLSATVGGAINLWLESDGTVTGRIGGTATGAVAFAIHINAAGQVDVAQYLALAHPDNGSYDESLNLAGLLDAIVTQTDADGDSATQSVGIGDAIQFQDDGPQVSTNAAVQLDDDALAGGNPGGVGDVNPDTANTSGMLALDFGRDGAGSIAWLATGAPTGFTYEVAPSGNLLIKQNGTTVITLTIDGSGNYTVMQNAPVMHAAGGNENGADFTVSYRVTDGDGDAATGQLAINVNDDTPTATIVRTTANAVLDESATAHDGDTNATADNVPPGADPFAAAYGTPFGAVAGLGLVTPTASAGADGGGSFSVTLGIVGGSGASSGLSATVGGAIKLWLESDGTVTGRIGGTATGAVAFAIRINSTGQVDAAQYLALAHPDNGSYDESLNLAGLLDAIVTQTDADGDSATQSVGIGNAIQFQDDGPQVSTNAAVQLDDDALAGGNPGGVGDVNPDTANTSGMLALDFGRDGAGSIAWLATGAPTGFTYEVAPSGNLLIKQNGTTVITLTIDGSGNYTVMQNAPVMHAAGGNENGADFTVSYRVTDGDGDAATGQLAINVNDDTPIVVSRSDLIYAGGSNPTPGGTGYFAYSIGADQHQGTWSQSNSDFASITLSGTLGTFPISSTAVTWVEEDGHHAVFHVAFDYMTNGASGSTAAEGGTLTFDKDAGTYHLTLGSPFPLVPVVETVGSNGFAGYKQDSVVTDKTQPMVSVATVTSGFYVQFTGYNEPGAGTGKDNLVAGGGSGANAFTNGELFTKDRAWVSVSGTAMGVAGDTLQKGEVLDMDFFNANPYGYSNDAPTKAVEGFYLKFDGISHDVSSGEDFVVVLKLVDAVTGALTTRAIVVDNLDIFVKNDPKIPVPAAYAGIPLDNNDGLVIIERNDYNGPNENWLVQGAQVLVSTEGITGSGYDLNPLTGVNGGSTATALESFSDPVNTKPKGNSVNNFTTDNDVMKLASVGFISTFNPDANLQFNVVLQDADGDMTPTQPLNVSVVGNTFFQATAAWEAIQGLAGRADTFVFASVATSPAGPLHDVIGNFEVAVDRIDLVGLDAKTSTVTDDAFSWIGAAAFSGVAGQLRFDDASHQLQGDVDGNGTADFVVEITGVTAASLSPANFVL